MYLASRKIKQKKVRNRSAHFRAGLRKKNERRIAQKAK